MAYNITLEGSNLKEAERLLREITTIFEQHKVVYWLEGGTLLGIRRENRLLPWDNDLDISMHAQETDKLAALIKSLKKNQYRVRLRYFEDESPEFKKGTLRMMKVRKRRFFGLIKGTVCLDVFVKYTKEENTYWEIANKTKSVPKHFYASFKNVLFQNKDYSIPTDTDAYLSYRYGNWQTPVKEWNTFTDDNALNRH